MDTARVGKQLDLPDPQDRHVLAAAIRAQARVIVTFNMRDFPPGALVPYSVDALHPDPFIAQWLDVAPMQVCAAAEAQRHSLRNPPKSVDEFLAILLRQGLPETVARLRTACYSSEGA